MTTTTKNKTKPITRVQRIQLQLLKLSSFNDFNGVAVADSLVANRDLWVSFLLDRENYYYPTERQEWIDGKKSAEKGDLPPSPLDTIRLRDLSQGYWNVDCLLILPQPGKEDSLELLVRRDWNADEIDWYDSGHAKHIWLNQPKVGEVIKELVIPKMLRVWWD